MEIADRLKNIRKDRNLTQADMAQLLGITQAGYSRIERGDIIPTADKLQLIANKFPTINLNWLITGNGDMYKFDLLEPLIINDLDIKKHRENKKISFWALANAISVDTEAMSAYEGGSAIPLSKYMDICRILDIDKDEAGIYGVDKSSINTYNEDSNDKHSTKDQDSSEESPDDYYQELQELKDKYIKVLEENIRQSDEIMELLEEVTRLKKQIIDTNKKNNRAETA